MTAPTPISTSGTEDESTQILGRRIWRIFPLITIAVLFWSLFESLTILPSHLAHSKEKEYDNTYISTLSRKWEKFQKKIKNLLYLLINHFYKPVLKLSLIHI